MLVTQIPNRRIRRAHRMWHTGGTMYISGRYNHYLDHQSARLAAFIHRESFAGVPAINYFDRYDKNVIERKAYMGPGGLQSLFTYFKGEYRYIGDANNRALSACRLRIKSNLNCYR